VACPRSDRSRVYFGEWNVPRSTTDRGRQDRDEALGGKLPDDLAAYQGPDDAFGREPQPVPVELQRCVEIVDTDRDHSQSLTHDLPLPRVPNLFCSEVR
jgi:hypothetical protein